MKGMENSQQYLLQIGFELVGYWLLSDGRIRFVLQKHNQASNVLYAFTSEEHVLYIGKTIQAFSQRMNGYQNPGPSQRTNIRNHKLIIEILQRKVGVNILALVPKESMSFRGVQVNIAAGIEDNLIAIFKPPWNVLK
jgi:hypothetical protein